VHSNDFSFFEEVAEILQEEPIAALDPERAGQLAAIGLVAERPFAPDERAGHPVPGRGDRHRIARTVSDEP
jgi:hypothetical protein